MFKHSMANVTHSVLLKLNLITLCEPQRARTSQRGRRGVGVEYSCTEVEVSSRPNVYTHTLDGLVFTHAHSVGCAGSWKLRLFTAKVFVRLNSFTLLVVGWTIVLQEPTRDLFYTFSLSYFPAFIRLAADPIWTGVFFLGNICGCHSRIIVDCHSRISWLTRWPWFNSPTAQC